MTSKASAPQDEVISASAVVTAPRGRKKELDPNLLATLRKVNATDGVSLAKTFGGVTSAKDKQTVGATIRKHWTEIHGPDGPKSKVDFHPVTGVPQVRMRG